MWFTLDSDPCLFTLLLHKNGLKNLNAREIFDIETLKTEIFDSIGLLFLFKYFKRDISISNSTDNFTFVKQKTFNNCGTIALINLILNQNIVSLENSEFDRLKKTIINLDPETAGNIVANDEVFKKNHNSLICEEIEYLKLFCNNEESSEGEAFHYSAILPYKNSSGLVEFDGLFSHPNIVDRSSTPWNNVAEDFLKKRIFEIQNKSIQSEIRFSIISIEPIDLKSFDINNILNENEKRIHNYFPDVVNFLKAISTSEKIENCLQKDNKT